MKIDTGIQVDLKVYVKIVGMMFQADLNNIIIMLMVIMIIVVFIIQEKGVCMEMIVYINMFHNNIKIIYIIIYHG